MPLAKQPPSNEEMNESEARRYIVYFFAHPTSLRRIGCSTGWRVAARAGRQECGPVWRLRVPSGQGEESLDLIVHQQRPGLVRLSQAGDGREGGWHGTIVGAERDGDVFLGVEILDGTPQFSSGIDIELGVILGAPILKKDLPSEEVEQDVELWLPFGGGPQETVCWWISTKSPREGSGLRPARGLLAGRPHHGPAMSAGVRRRGALESRTGPVRFAFSGPRRTLVASAGAPDGAGSHPCHSALAEPCGGRWTATLSSPSNAEKNPSRSKRPFVRRPASGRPSSPSNRSPPDCRTRPLWIFSLPVLHQANSGSGAIRLSRPPSRFPTISAFALATPRGVGWAQHRDPPRRGPEHADLDGRQHHRWPDLVVSSGDVAVSSLVGEYIRFVRGSLAPYDTEVAPIPVSSTSTFAGKPVLPDQDDFFAGRIVRFIDGICAGQSALVASYEGSTRTFHLASALPVPPAADDKFVVAMAEEYVIESSNPEEATIRLKNPPPLPPAAQDQFGVVKAAFIDYQQSLRSHPEEGMSGDMMYCYRLTSYSDPFADLPLGFPAPPETDPNRYLRSQTTPWSDWRVPTTCPIKIEFAFESEPNEKLLGPRIDFVMSFVGTRSERNGRIVDWRYRVQIQRARPFSLPTEPGETPTIGWEDIDGPRRSFRPMLPVRPPPRCTIRSWSDRVPRFRSRSNIVFGHWSTPHFKMRADAERYWSGAPEPESFALVVVPAGTAYKEMHYEVSVKLS